MKNTRTHHPTITTLAQHYHDILSLLNIHRHQHTKHSDTHINTQTHTHTHRKHTQTQTGTQEHYTTHTHTTFSQYYTYGPITPTRSRVTEGKHS